MIAERGLAVPSAYREVFRVLGEAKLLDAEQTDPLERWAGMRNVIAHQYGALDLEVVADALYDHLQELDAFAVTMARLLSAEPQ